MKKYLPLILGAFLLVVGIGITAYPAIQSIVGLSVASTSTTWNNLKDVAVGDNQTNGLAATGIYVFDGTNWDGVRGDTTNGFDVDVTRLPFSTQSTTGVNANGAGSTITMSTNPMTKYTMIINRTAGTTNTVEVDLECSIDNTAFIQISTITDLTNEPVLSAVADVPCAYLRYNVVTIGSGNTVAIDILATR